jgi:hypothetical protein
MPRVLEIHKGISEIIRLYQMLQGSNRRYTSNDLDFIP